MKNLSAYFLSFSLVANFANAAPPIPGMPQPIVDQAQEEVLDIMSADEMEGRIQGTYQEPAQAVQQPTQQFTPPTGNSTADLIARLAYAEEQMRKLTGQVQQLELELKNVSAQAATAAQTAQTAQVAATNATKTLADSGSQYVTRPGEVNDKYVIKVDGAESVDAAIAADQAAQEEVPNEEADFNAGVAQVSEQNLSAAKTKFTEFLTKYPTSEKTADVYFWLGEISMDEQLFKEGALNYLKSYKADKQGKRAEEALLKSSIALGKLGKKEEACKNLNTLKGTEGLQDLIKEQASSEAIKLGCK